MPTTNFEVSNWNYITPQFFFGEGGGRDATSFQQI